MTEKTLNLAGYKCKALLHRSEGVPVVFLHGYSYTREIWQQLGITDLLVEKRIPFMALDMPYGRKTECTPKTTDVAVNVSVARQAVTQTFGSQTPIVVGASLGGNIALHYAQQFPVKGLLLVAPASALEDSLTGSYSKFGFPVRVVWGTEDNIISGEEMRTLVDKLPHGKLVTYQDAGHSAYNHQPDRFKRDLLELYAAAE